MRYGSYTASVLLLVAGPALAAEPSGSSPPGKAQLPAASAAPAAPKPVAPTTPAPTTPAPATPAPTNPPTAKPGNPPAGAAPAPGAPAPVAPAAPKATVPAASAGAAAGTPGASGRKPGETPPAEYYVEPGFAAPAANTSEPPLNAAPGAPPAATGAPPVAPGPPPPPPADAGAIYEPPPPGFFPGDEVFEPPPPPEPHHIAPRSALWLGARVGWFIPFGNAWARGSRDSAGNLNLRGVPLRDYLSSGPMFELNAGARLARNYHLFALWERAELGAGRGDLDSAAVGRSSSGDTDFWAVGVRATSDADRVGFVTEIAVGYRRARAEYADGSQVQFTDSPFEARLGVGADIRVNPIVTLSPMLTIGVGSFGKIERVASREVGDHTGPDDQADGHAWTTLTLGGHFDLFV